MAKKQTCELKSLPAPHTARRSTAYLERHGIDWIRDWPANSPDLNPCEHVWALLNRRVSDKCPTDVGSLHRAVLEAWDETPQSVLDALTRSFRGKCADVYARGGL